jgi:predicted nucleic acid-binding protein
LASFRNWKWSVLHASIDTCSLINLLADKAVLPSFLGSGVKGSPESITFHVPSNVSREAVYILQPSVDDPSKLEKVEIDLTDHFTSGVLVQNELEGEEEMASFVTLAASLDDGEAACLAIAASRNWMMATDDRIACRLAKELAVSVITTPMIIRQWSVRTGANPAELRRVIQAIGKFARFVPHTTSPDHGWWTKASGS